jgi:KDO2-lipid IV(A) lauroyltransferase
MTFVEACVFFFRAPSVLLSRVEICGESHLAAAAARGRGVLLLTAHYGNWELLAASRALTAHELSVVIRPLDHPVLDRVVARFRERTGVELITRHRGLREILDALRRGRLVGILLDQNVSRGQGVFVPFFGVPASTSKSLAVISLRTGAPVVPAFIRRRPDGRHRIEIGAALPPPPDGDVVAYTASFNRAIEEAIRQAPEQWFWLHRRWKTRPQEASR